MRRHPRYLGRFLVAIQVSRLNEALLMAFSAMSPSNFKAVDRVVKIVHEFVRCGGAFAAEWARPESPRLDAPIGLGVRRRVNLRPRTRAAGF